MENAVKALLMAAGVLIGVMILSLGVSLFSALSEYVEKSQNEIVSKEIQQFNNRFIKYINCNKNTDEVNFTLTIQDIVTAANTAYENNKKYEFTEQENDNYYVTIKLGENVLEGNINSKSTKILLNGLGKEYKCSIEDVKINEVTGRVYEVNFHEI